MPVPVGLSVLGLYDEFDHHVTFPKDDEFAIIYGPNGVGKTRFFEIIQALSTLNTFDIASLPFDSAEITYDDDTKLSVVKSNTPKSPGRTFYLNTPGTLFPSQWKVGSDVELDQAGNRRRIYAGGSTWIYMGQNTWVDENDGENVSTLELRDRYNVDIESTEVPAEFQQFRSSVETHLIETQRLRNRPLPPRRARITRHRPISGRNVSDLETTVSRYAADLQGRLAEALADNSRRTQALDRTFPRRLLDESTPEQDEAEDSIRARYAVQNQKRQRLAELSLIGSESDLPLQDKELQGWQRRVLRTYLDDTEEKLKTFDDLLSKVNLLEEIINKRFIRKKIRVNVEEGLSIEAERSGAQILPQDLSSGEQHELIMFYDLLFRVSPGALVMIDEPEISLHVAWQRDFLNDILKVAHVSSARILVATHSPQIIGKWRSRTTELKFDSSNGELGEDSTRE